MQFREHIVTPGNNIIRSVNYRLDDITRKGEFQFMYSSSIGVTIMYSGETD